MKKPCCYYCRWWDGSNASNSWGSTTQYAFCSNPEKYRLDTGFEVCPSIDEDFCTEFEPVTGWTPEWERIARRYNL